MKRFALYVGLVFLLLVGGGCGAAAPPMNGAKQMAMAPGEMADEARMMSEAAMEAPMMEMEEEYAVSSGSDGSTSPLPDVSGTQQNRVVIYTGDMALVVKDTQEAISAVTELADRQGGYVSNSYVYQQNEVLRGSIAIRVQADKYNDTLEYLRSLAVRVESENTNTQDVTEEFVDLEARKANLEYTESALQKLLDERYKVGSTEDILEVYRELTSIRGQIEQIEGRLRYLSSQAALSTITIELIPDVLYQPVSVAGWEPRGVAKSALQALVSAVQGLASVLIWFVILVLPLLVIVLIPLVLVILLIRWLVRRRRARKA